jgi:YihY family inner membrane protein
LRGRVRAVLQRFWHIAWDANITGLSAMLAYNMLLGVIPVALLALFIAGQVLSSHAIQQSILVDLRSIFPGATQHTLDSLLDQVQGSTATTGVLALVASLWLASSFWGALDTSFSRIYNCDSRPWLAQKRFGIVMVGVVFLLMVATVAVPTVQSLLKSSAEVLPIDLQHVDEVVYVLSLGIGLALLFGCLAVIYATVPNRPVRWRAVWPGALAATAGIGVVSTVFPLYLSNISTIARFGTTIVFVLIVLLWFYVIALIILAGASLNALRVRELWLD